MEQKTNTFNSSILFLGIIIILGLFLIKFFDISYPITITNKTVSAELSVVGEGKVDVVPDSANVSAGITADGQTVAEVQKKIDDANNKIVAALEKLDIAKADIKTSNYSINPTRDYRPGGISTVSGYSGNATLSIKVKKIEQLPEVISAATEAGANQIYNTNYSIENPEKYREQARNLAIQNAKDQAQKLANQLGIRLGRITNISESSPDNVPVPMFNEAKGLGGAPSVPDLQPGSETVSSTVTLYFEKN